MLQENKQVDILINVFSKPWQTALSLLSLLRYSGQYIDKIYFHEELATSEFERKDHSNILKFLENRIIYHNPKYWLSSNTTDEAGLLEEDYRLSMRYQYGFENSDKKYGLLIHNDIEVTGDIVGELLNNIGDCTAIGELGQCWWCPAGQLGHCVEHEYTKYKPKYHQLMYIYNTNMDYQNRRAYNLGLKQEFWEKPWPLPECRVNEWCMLVNLEKARPDTMPKGSAIPIGSMVASGAKIGEDWEHVVNLDTGVQWFRDLNHAGHTFTHYPIEKYIIHDRRGKASLSSAEKYVMGETTARLKIQQEYPEFFNITAGK